MAKLLTISIVILAIISSYGATYYYGGEHRENKLKLAQANSDLILAAHVMNARNDIDTKLMESIPSLYDNDDGAVTGSSIAVWLPAPKPARNPLTKAPKADAN